MQAAYDGSMDAFGLKLDPSKAGAAGIDYFTYLGSDGLQVAYASISIAAATCIWRVTRARTFFLASAGRARSTIAGNCGRVCDRFQPGFIDACDNQFLNRGTSETTALAGVAAPLTIGFPNAVRFEL